MLSATSVAVSRLILSLHSLAANLAVDPKWLLNNAELSRVRWRKGARDGELIVEVDVAEAEVEETEVELGVVMPGKRMSELTPFEGGIKVEERTRTKASESPPSNPNPNPNPNPNTRKPPGGETPRRPRTGITTTQYGHFEDMPNLFYKGKGDTRP